MPTAKKEPAGTTEKKAPAHKAAAKKSEGAPAKLELKDFLAEVQHRAYEIYLKREKDNKPGDEVSDWLQAEADVRKKLKI